ncbi:TetR/AcrR family transcriptional regulator [Pseudofrankia inefficax]|uniref:Transcriptional regulator, TetR family n=1 Tax=Pseudofrankia inefficax (strain DSM 45817 / CECT 9037 / DDB 130130 / EuI1c) TaxID=298654 RepID=E3J5B7_PSEI1|nr:TetR family transcriptional regulator [Pseudofrankia inefficax]ADP80715.1 transcriptional regulator, TetR family [Pseudofrankia inefficax]
MTTGTAKGTAARRLLAGLSATAAVGAPVLRPLGRHGGTERLQLAGDPGPTTPDGGDPTDESDAAGGGLRERKKLRTRQTIVETAHALFTEHGYDATTIEAIAAGADVSVRTFFRYFATKEEVALAPLDEVGELALAALGRRPGDEPPLAALRAATLDAWVAMAPRPAAFRGYVEHLLSQDAAPAVSAAMLARMMRLGDRLATAIRPRFPAPGGPTPGGVDLRPQLTAAAFLAAVQVGIRAWFARGDHDLDEMLAIVEYCVDQLVPADSPPGVPGPAPSPAPARTVGPPPAAPRSGQPTGPPFPAGG